MIVKIKKHQLNLLFNSFQYQSTLHCWSSFSLSLSISTFFTSLFLFYWHQHWFAVKRTDSLCFTFFFSRSSVFYCRHTHFKLPRKSTSPPIVSSSDVSFRMQTSLRPKLKVCRLLLKSCCCCYYRWAFSLSKFQCYDSSALLFHCWIGCAILAAHVSSAHARYFPIHPNLVRTRNSK